MCVDSKRWFWFVVLAGKLDPRPTDRGDDVVRARRDGGYIQRNHLGMAENGWDILFTKILPKTRHPHEGGDPGSGAFDFL